MTPERPGRAVVLAAGVAVVLAVTAVTAGAQSLGERLDDARERQEQLQARIDDAAEDLARLESRVGRLDTRRQRLQAKVGRLTETARAADRRIERRARTLYKRGSLGPVAIVLGAEVPSEALTRASMVERLTVGDRVQLEQARTARRRARAAASRLSETEERLQVARADMRERVEQLRGDLEEAADLEEQLVAERRERRAERRRRRQARQRAEQEQAGGGGSGQAAPDTAAAERAPTRSGLACPVGRPRSYSDTWGAPRSGGRSHEGTDILADYGTPIYAITSGTWDVMSPGNSAGNWAILHGDDGNSYWYLHLQSHVAGDGAHVATGEQVATNGDTGNAEGIPHLHFELHPGGGGPVNPYPTVRRACG